MHAFLELKVMMLAVSTPPFISEYDILAVAAYYY
jgi:hypothetical protein